MRKFTNSFILVVFSILIAVFLLELTARFILRQPYYAFPQNYFVPDESYGYGLAPDFKGNYAQPEYTISIDTNSEGLRDFQRPLSPRDFRILALGDSFSFGLGVALNDTYLTRLEEMLNRAGLKERVAVIKAGVVGYSTFNEKAYLVKKGLSFRPKLVLVQFWWDDLGIDRITYLSQMGFLTTGKVQNFAQFRLFLNRHLRSYAALRRIFTLVSHKAIFANHVTDIAQDPLVLKNKIFVTIGQFKEIDKICASIGSNCLFVLVPSKEFIDGDEAAWGYFCTELKNNHIRFLDLRPVLKKAQENKEAVFFKVDAHLNKNGHRIVSQEIYDFLLTDGFLSLTKGTKRI